MTRVLVSTMPATGHVTPVIPLVTELVSRGHEVTWHTGAAYATAVQATGARFTPFVETPDFTQVPVRPDDSATGMAVGVTLQRRLFIDRMAGQVADYQEILEEFPAHIVVADLCSLGAGALHELGGPVWVTLGITPLVTFDPEIPPWGTGRPPATTALQRLRNRIDHGLARRLFMPKVTALLDAARASIGLPPLPDGTQYADVLRSPYLHLMPTTPAFEYPRANLEPQVQFVGPLLPPPPPDFTAPTWWHDMDAHPVVHVTQGTYATDEANLIRPTLDALADDDVLVVVTTTEPAGLGDLPDNVRVERFAPHAHLLPHIDVMVTNAGYNGVLAALAQGVPLVCAGQTEDKADVSGRVAWTGAGIDLHTDTPSAADVRDAVRTVLFDATYRSAAAAIRADFARHDGAAEAADLLEQVAHARTQVPRVPSGLTHQV
jgi:UDP:flavonoid glycosyltransferase YjiC (YdhE family)